MISSDSDRGPAHKVRRRQKKSLSSDSDVNNKVSRRKKNSLSSHSDKDVVLRSRRKKHKAYASSLLKLKNSRARKALHLDISDSESSLSDVNLRLELEERSSDNEFIAESDDGIYESFENEDNGNIDDLKAAFASLAADPQSCTIINNLNNSFHSMNTSESDDEDEILLTENEKLFLQLVAADNVQLVEELIVKNKNLVNVIDQNKRTALHIATMRGYTAIVELLLKQGIDPDLEDCLHFTALAHAAINKFSKCFKLLLEHTNMKKMKKSLKKHLNRVNLLHLLVMKCPIKSVQMDDLQDCLQILKMFDSRLYETFMYQEDDRLYIPLLAAIVDDQPQVCLLNCKTEVNVPIKLKN